MPESQEETFEIRGDVRDPSGKTDLSGAQMGVDFTKNALAHPKFRWRDRISETDVYAAGDGLMLHFYCPKCTGALSVTSERKEIRFEAGGPHGGRLSISEFRCTYKGCGLHIRIEDNVAKEIS